MLKLNKTTSLLHKFNLLSKYLNHIKTIEFNEFEVAVLEIFGKSWAYDVEDIAYFYESLRHGVKVNLIKNKDGTINKIHVVHNIGTFNNFNDSIKNYFSEDVIGNIM